MAWALKCDICGRYVDTSGNPLSRMLPSNCVVRIAQDHDDETYELCECCYTRIKNFINNLKEEKSNVR